MRLCPNRAVAKKGQDNLVDDLLTQLPADASLPEKVVAQDCLAGLELSLSNGCGLFEGANQVASGPPVCTSRCP